MKSSGNAVLQLANITSGIGASDGFLEAIKEWNKRRFRRIKKMKY